MEWGHCTVLPINNHLEHLCLSERFVDVGREHKINLFLEEHFHEKSMSDKTIKTPDIKNVETKMSSNRFFKTTKALQHGDHVA